MNRAPVFGAQQLSCSYSGERRRKYNWIGRKYLFATKFYKPSSSSSSKSDRARRRRTTTTTTMASSSSSLPDERGYPHLIVFDLDACFWNQEMYQLSEICDSKDNLVENMNGEEICTGAVSGRTVIKMHAGARQALRDFYEGKYPGVRLAAASSADTPLAVQIGKSALRNLEIAPGVSCAKVFSMGWSCEFDVNMQIGRTPPLSPNKAKSHFPILRKFTNVEYHKMLFFDDCNWGDHCGEVNAKCKEAGKGFGPEIQRTPRGLGVKEWELGLEKYKSRHEKHFA